MQTNALSPRFGAIYKLQNKEADRYIDARDNFNKEAKADRASEMEYFGKPTDLQVEYLVKRSISQAFDTAYAVAKTNNADSIKEGFSIEQVPNLSSNSKHQKDVFIFTETEHSNLKRLQDKHWRLIMQDPCTFQHFQRFEKEWKELKSETNNKTSVEHVIEMAGDKVNVIG